MEATGERGGREKRGDGRKVGRKKREWEEKEKRRNEIERARNRTWEGNGERKTREEGLG